MARPVKHAPPMKHACLLGLLVVGCAEQPIPDPVEEVVDVEPVAPYIGGSYQGRQLLGAPDDLQANGTHFRVSVQAASPAGLRLAVNAAGPLGANGAHLIASNGTTTFSGADPRFIGVEMMSPDGARLKITGVTADSSGSTLYSLQYRGPKDTEWVDYCDGTGGAVPLHGSFSSNRIHQNTPTSITFGCMPGVAYKCSVLWGYVPGIAGPGNPNWDHHQACIQMANAAYCGAGPNGLPFTREETPIEIQDFVKGYGMGDVNLTHPRPYPGDPDTFYFEAAWRPNGLPPICLSRLRWAALAPNPCPGVLEDPRFSSDPEAVFCDDLSYSDLRARGGVIVSGTMLMDAQLWRWRSSSPSGDHAFTTIRGYHVNIGGNTSQSTPPPGYTEFVARDGVIMRNLTGTLDANKDMIALYVYSDGKDQVLSDAFGTGLPATYTRGEFEGYSFRAPDRVPNLTPLKLCVDAQGQYDVTIGSCASVVATLGYALPAP